MALVLFTIARLFGILRVVVALFPSVLTLGSMFPAWILEGGLVSVGLLVPASGLVVSATLVAVAVATVVVPTAVPVSLVPAAAPVSVGAATAAATVPAAAAVSFARAASAPASFVSANFLIRAVRLVPV